MTISLQKGGQISLAKEAPAMKKATIGLGWREQRSSGGDDFDLDASLFLLDSNGRCPNDLAFIFYNNPKSQDGAVVHMGDDRTGSTGDADAETIELDLERVSLVIERIAIVVTIHMAKERRQNFGMVDNAYVRIMDSQTGSEVARYDLTEDYSAEDAVIFAELERDGDAWSFRAIGDGHSNGLAGLAGKYGLDAA